MPIQPKKGRTQMRDMSTRKILVVEEAARTQACKTQLALMANVKWIT